MQGKANWNGINLLPMRLNVSEQEAEATWF